MTHHKHLSGTAIDILKRAAANQGRLPYYDGRDFRVMRKLLRLGLLQRVEFGPHVLDSNPPSYNVTDDGLRAIFDECRSTAGATS